MSSTLKRLSLKITAFGFLPMGITPTDIDRTSLCLVANKPRLSWKFARWILCYLIALPFTFFLPSFITILAIVFGFREANVFHVVFLCSVVIVIPGILVMIGEAILVLSGQDLAEGFQNMKHLEVLMKEGMFQFS